MSSQFPPPENITSKENNSHVGSPSPRKKRNNSTPTRKNAAEKKKILQQLISPNTNNKVTLGELIQLSETEDARNFASGSSENHFKETAFIERPSSSSTIEQPQRKLTRQVSSDPKLEKKVTFARLLSKMSAEINHGTDIDGNNRSSALSLPTDVQLRANSVPQSPCTNDIRSPHSTSSNQGSDSLSSSELALHEFSLKNNIRKNRPKVSSADSILAMFRNFASSNVGLNLPASLIFSPSSSTPTASSPQDDMGDDESSTSSIATPVSFSSGAPDSPVFYRQSTIEVPVMDALSAHKTTPAQNLLHPPTILLEIPGNITKCLSPIKEMPTPMPSPALTPIMPRPQRIAKSSHVRDFAFSDDDDKNQHYLSKNPNFVSDTCNEMRVRDSDNESITIYTTSSENSACSMRKSKFMTVPTISIDIDPPTPEERRDKRSPQRPKDLIIPELVVQTPSPTKERYPVVIIPGSPPPQRERASLGETSGLFPNKQQQKRLLMQFEKPGSLDFPFVPPMITITANMSEVESDNEFMSPAVTSKASLMPNKLMPNSSGMTYLSPFSMCTRGDRAPSEGNLSSSGYSSMASPGPSRCGSNSKLCASEMDSTNLTPSTSNPRRFQSILKKPDDKDRNKDEDGSECFRKRSDSETLSDETLLESNDEGIGTDHIDEKIEDGDIKSARDLEVFIGKELLETGKSLMRIDEPVMSQLQLPSIVIQSELGFDKLSPVSSRSESPLSDRNIGMARFSPQFYGKKDQQLPFTDSDGLYDFPSSDGKGGSTASVFLRKSNGKRRERRSTKSTNLSASPTKSSVSNEKICVQLEIPSQSTSHQSTSKHQQSSSLVRKSPKRRLYRYTPSSSSSTESLTAGNGGKEMPSTKLRDRLIESIEMKHNQTESERCGQKPDQQKRNVIGSVPGGKKVSRMKAISNQIRFLRRLEQALKERGKSKYIGDVDDDSDLESTSVTSPLLGSSSKDSEQKSTSSRFTRQKRIVHPSENSAIVDNISD